MDKISLDDFIYSSHINNYDFFITKLDNYIDKLPSFIDSKEELKNKIIRWYDIAKCKYEDDDHDHHDTVGPLYFETLYLLII